MAEVEKREYDSREPSLRCARLEIVIPTPARPLKKQAKQQPPTSRLQPPLLLSGQLTPTQRGGGCGRSSGPSSYNSAQTGQVACPGRGGGGAVTAAMAEGSPPRDFHESDKAKCNIFKKVRIVKHYSAFEYISME
jgi:hypothetical protein